MCLQTEKKTSKIQTIKGKLLEKLRNGFLDLYDEIYVHVFAEGLIKSVDYL